MALRPAFGHDAPMKISARFAVACGAFAAAGAAAAQPSYGEAAAHALRLLAPLPHLNPTEVTVAAAEAATRARPRDADAWNQLGQSLDVAGRTTEAVAAFRRAAQLPPRVLGRGYLYRDLAEAQEKAGDLQGAIASMRAAFGFWPLSRERRHCAGYEEKVLVRLLVAAHDADGALAFYAPLYRADRDVPECRDIHAALEAAARD